MTETVLVTGVGGPAGRAGATFFHGRGYRVVCTDMAEVASPSPHFRIVPPARHPGFGDALVELARTEGARLVVCTVQEELPLVARLRGRLRAQGCALSISDPPGVDLAADKLATALALEAAGVAVPRTFAPADRDAAVRELGFPLLSKPRVGRGGRGVVVHRGPEDLAQAGDDAVWQEFLPGEEYDANLFVERGGAVASSVLFRKTGLREGLVGNATGVERAHRPDVAELTARAARALHLEGPLDVDVRTRTDGSAAVLEVNARLGAHVLAAPEVLRALESAWREGRCD